MKSLKYLFFISITALTIASCAYKDNEWAGNIDLQGVGSYLRVANVTTKPNYDIDSATIESVNFNLDVIEYGEHVKEVNIYVVKGASNNVSTWKKIKTIAGAPTMTLNIKGSEILAALGIAKTAIKKGDKYTFYNEVIDVQGRKYNMENVNASFESFDPYASPNSYRSCFRWKPQTTIK